MHIHIQLDMYIHLLYNLCYIILYFFVSHYLKIEYITLANIYIYIHVLYCIALCYIILYETMYFACCILLSYSMSYPIVLPFTILLCVTSCSVMFYSILVHYAVLGGVLLNIYHIVSCYVELYHILLYFILLYSILFYDILLHFMFY